MKLHSKQLPIGMSRAVVAQLWARLDPSRNAYRAPLMVISKKDY